MAVELVTGYSGTEHVSSSDDGARQAGTVGTGMYALETVEDPLAATLENANTVTVGPGDVLINGRHVRLTGSTTFAVPVGTQAMQTSNLLVLRYELAEDETESVTAITLTGEPAASDPADPALATGSVLDGDSPVDMPLYRVVTTGIESAQPVRLFETVPPIAGLTLGGLPGSLTSDQLPVVPVSKGGTGVTTAEAARKALRAPAVGGVAEDASVYCDYNYDQRVMTQVSGPDDIYMTVAADDYFGLYHNTAQSWLWQLWPDNSTNGLLRAGRGGVSNLSRDTLYGLAPGTYLVMNNATNGPESGSYGNLLVSYSADSRVVALLSYDNGHVYTTYGASASGRFLWKRIDPFGDVMTILYRGTWSSGTVTLNKFTELAFPYIVALTSQGDILVGSAIANDSDYRQSTINLFGVAAWAVHSSGGDSGSSDAAVVAARITTNGNSATLEGLIRQNVTTNYYYGVSITQVRAFTD